MRIIFSIFFLFMLVAPACFSQVKSKNKPAAKATIQPSLNKNNDTDSLIPAANDSAEIRVKIVTDLGIIIVKLYNRTPRHRDNFVKLVNEHFYDSLLFHRVINSFMIQGGDPKSKNAAPGMLGTGEVGYTIPAEFDSTLYHKRGALAAARNNNPEKASGGCQFYIVQGRTYSNSELDIIETKNNIKFSAAKRMTYRMNGGTPALDFNYTVFGEVETGMEVVDEIAAMPTDSNNRPINNIKMKMKVMDEAVK
jgi:peptidyl-prolyl cis-trans isomerase B (cyclophilin B)